ncbi:Fanconi anemia group I protein-like [Babylonia areolata]|uniref:Fanconi anemia group I protein-like n=1 Tax=Babylonia areolata TaxID=304850 RepID=UPI003FD1AA31
MEKEIVKLYQDGKTEKLKDVVKGQTLGSLRSAVDKSLCNSRDPLVFSKAVFQGLDCEDGESADLMVGMFKHLVTTLGKTDFSNKLADDIVWLLLMESNRLTGPCLAELAQFYVDSVKSGTFQGGKAMNVFPKILSVIESQESIVYHDSSMKGAEFKGHVLNNLCSCKWSPQTVIHLAAMFNDVPLSSDELRFVLEKIIRQFDDLDLRDIPALVYQLLLLSEKGHKRLILEGITSFFINKDSLARSQNNMMDSEDLMEDTLNVDVLRQTEGTAILHISFAVMEQRELGQEFLKYLKAWQFSCASRVLSPFNVALALSIAGMNVLNEQILEFLKSTVLRSFRDHQRHEQSYWVRENFSEQRDIQQMVLETVTSSSSGWEHVVQGLVQLGFLLMDSFGPRLVFGRPETMVKGQLTPNQSACQLGSKILLKMFKGHEIVRSDILGQIFNRVMTETSAPTSHYLSLLSEAVQTAPLFLLESVGKVREVFDCLPLLPPDTAQGLLVALLPLLKVSMSLKDTLILLLRKSIFSRQVEECKIGVQGYLAILKSFKVLGGLPGSQGSQSSQPFSASQVPVDIHRQYNRASNEALCLEILGILKRCLSQQADIRLHLYQGLVDVLSRNTQLKARIMDMLHKQMKKYYESDEDTVPPLKLELCITASGENVYLAEPLAHLLSCIQQCVHRVKMIRLQNVDGDDDNNNEEADEDDDAGEGGSGSGMSGLEDMLNSLTTRILQADMEDFELDKAADFSTANSVGVRNNIFAILLLGVYEVLMEHNFLAGDYSARSSEQVVELFGKYKALSDVLRDKASGGGGKKGRPASSSNTKTPNSLLSLPCVVRMLEALFSDESPDRREGVEVLRGSEDFGGHVVAVAIQKLQQVVDKGTCDGANCGSEKLFTHCCTLGRLFLNHYMENQLAGEGRERKRKMVGPCLDGLVHVFTLASHRGHDAIIQCLLALFKSDEEHPDIHEHIKRFQRLVSTVLSADEDQRHLKDVGNLMTVVSLLTAHLTPAGPQYEQVYTWICKLCEDGNVEDVNTSKLLLGCLLKLSVQMKHFPQLLRDVMQDLHSQLGDVEQDVEVEDRTHFSLITTRTAAPHVVMLLLPLVDQDLDDTEWVLSRMKTDSTPHVMSEEVGPTQQEGFEKLVCSRLAVLVSGFHEISQSAVPPGPCVAAMFKSMTKFYSTILSLVKYYLHLYATHSGHMSSRFEKLVKLMGMQLTPHIYNFITFVQTVESEQLEHEQQKDLKKKKKPQKASQKATKPKAPPKGGKHDKMIPNLIFSIEEVERHLVKLSKKAKVNLMENIKTSTSRDFRINVNIVQETLQVSSDEDEPDEEEEPEGPTAAGDAPQEDEQTSEVGSDAENRNPDNSDEEQTKAVNAEPEPEPEPAQKRRRLGKLQKAK